MNFVEENNESLCDVDLNVCIVFFLDCFTRLEILPDFVSNGVDWVALEEEKERYKSRKWRKPRNKKGKIYYLF